jgi:hypothetical protein
MKKLIIIGLLLINISVNSQIRFIDKEYFTASLAVDPCASYKEGGVDIVGEIELVSYWKYVKFNIQSFAVLDGGYIDGVMGFGVNLTPGIFDKWRLYSGGRLGFINRSKYIYPIVGFEGGFDYNINEKYFIGLRGTSDYRADFKYSGAEPSMRYSGFIRVGTSW